MHKPRQKNDCFGREKQRYFVSIEGVFAAVFQRSEGEILFEGVGKVALGGEAEIGGDGGKRFFRMRQQVTALLKFFFLDKVGNGFARFFFEFFGKVRAAHIEVGGDVFRGDRL